MESCPAGKVSLLKQVKRKNKANQPALGWKLEARMSKSETTAFDGNLI